LFHLFDNYHVFVREDQKIMILFIKTIFTLGMFAMPQLSVIAESVSSESSFVLRGNVRNLEEEDGNQIKTCTEYANVCLKVTVECLDENTVKYCLVPTEPACEIPSHLNLYVANVNSEDPPPIIENSFVGCSKVSACTDCEQLPKRIGYKCDFVQEEDEGDEGDDGDEDEQTLEGSLCVTVPSDADKLPDVVFSVKHGQGCGTVEVELPFFLAEDDGSYNTFTCYGQCACGGPYQTTCTIAFDSPTCTTPPGPTTETSFATRDKDQTSNCFSDFGIERWGWTNGPFTSGNTYEMEIYAGAGQCDISKGEEVGTVEVVYDANPDVVIVNYALKEGYTLEEVHVYVGEFYTPEEEKEKVLPKNKKGDFTVAPGDYQYKKIDFDPDDATEFTLEASVDGHPVYVIAHAVVSGVFP
jgi:hypothetical protein